MNQDLRAAYRILSQLEKSKSLADEVFDSLPGIYVMVDITGRIYRANGATANFFGRDPEDVPGLNIQKLFSLEAWSEVIASFESVATGLADRAELEAPASDHNGLEHPYHWEINRLPVKRGSGQALLSMIGRDVSELKRALRSVLDLEKDLDFARAVQSLLLPPVDSDRTGSWAMAAHYEPAAKAGGDWWRCEKREDGTALFLVGDVTGHGAGGGMVTAMVAGIYSSFTAHHGTRDVPAIFEEINKQLTRLRGQTYWMTLLAVEIRPRENKMSWYCAAAPPAILLKSGGETSDLGGAGRPLGSGALQLASGEADFKEGDRLFCATDGLFELSPEISATFLKRSFVKALRSEAASAERAKARVLEEWSRWAKKEAIHDDVAFLVVDHVGAKGATDGKSDE